MGMCCFVVGGQEESQGSESEEIAEAGVPWETCDDASDQTEADDVEAAEANAEL